MLQLLKTFLLVGFNRLQLLAGGLNPLWDESEVNNCIIIKSKWYNSNARVIQALANTMAEAAAERQENLRLIIQQQSEIRGLQTENKRMWEMLLDQRNRDDNPNA